MQILTRWRVDLCADPDVLRLCRALGNLPLALDLAAAFFRKKPRLGAGAYLAYLERHGLERTHALARLGAAAVEAYQSSSLVPAIEAQWSMLDTDAARALLGLVAIHGPNAAIPVARLGRMSGLFDDGDGLETPLTDAVQDAVTANLLHALPGRAVQMHVLVRDCILQRKLEHRGDVETAALSQLISAYEAVPVLESELAARGIDALLEDLRVVLEFQVAGQAGLLAERGASLQRLLRLEAHHLRSGSREHPSLVAQQLHTRAVVLALEPWITATAARLRELGDVRLLLRWHAGRQADELLCSLTGLEANAAALAIAADGSAVAAAAGANVTTWRLPEGTRGPCSAMVCRVTALGMSGDGRCVAIGREDGALVVQRLDTGQETFTIPLGDQPIAAIDTGGPGDLLLAATPGGVVWIGSFDDPRAGALHVTGRAIHAAGLAGASAILVASPEGDLACLELPSRTPRWERGAAAGEGPSLAVTSDGRRAITIARGWIQLWDLHTGDVLRTFQEVRPGSSVAITADDRFAITSTGVKDLHVWNLETGEMVSELHGHAVTSALVANSRRANRLVSSGFSGELRAWRVPAAWRPPQIAGHEKAVCAITPALAGKRCASASMDYKVKVWDMASGAEVFSGSAGWGPAQAIATNLATDRILVGFLSRVGIWDAATGARLHEVDCRCDGIRAIAMANSGEFWVTGASDREFGPWGKRPTVVELSDAKKRSSWLTHRSVP